MTRPIVVDVDQDENAKAWWQRGSLNRFREKICGMRKADLEALGAEISGRLAVIQGQIEGGGHDDEWRRRAKMSLGYIAERRGIVSAELTRRNVDHRAAKVKFRAERIERARASLAKDDMRGAVEALIELLDPDTRWED
jgi:hypothetical protein